MPRGQKKDKPEPFRCRWCNKEIVLESGSTSTWVHTHSGQTLSNDVMTHNAKPKSRKKKKN